MQKKTITMNENHTGSPDGITVNRYLEGETYTIPAELADIFTLNGWAVETDAPEAASEPASPYEALSDDDLAAAVLAHDPEADPAEVANAIAADRAAVIDALPAPKPARKPRPRRAAAAKKK